ncbi:AGC protein kinase [Tremella mesenterica]|uniref:non-specific serine/threonine protein kinase n=1 Tax=Tremella mesenterica TaxID=5217 RepID=A0A4Q1BI80_TREME|nr:AGC protein kinase [Tremella mesenterica]
MAATAIFQISNPHTHTTRELPPSPPDSPIKQVPFEADSELGRPLESLSQDIKPLSPLYTSNALTPLDSPVTSSPATPLSTSLDTSSRLYNGNGQNVGPKDPLSVEKNPIASHSQISLSSSIHSKTILEGPSLEPYPTTKKLKIDSTMTNHLSPPISPIKDDHSSSPTRTRVSDTEEQAGPSVLTPSTSHSSPISPQSDGATARICKVKEKVGLARQGRKMRGARLEDFQLVRVLGRGCAGRVLLVKHAKTSSIYAMKAISKRSVFTHGELHHTLAELSILRRFAEHEPDNGFVSKLHFAFTDRENFYLVLDFYPGGDLATQLEIHGTLGHMRTRFYAVDIVQGLQDLHRHGIIMRDLKPENVLLDARGHAVLADFGLAKEFGYRGKPMPVSVAQYPGEKVLPPWAGMGLGSERLGKKGEKKIVVDRAYSFVGTSDYLAPEVIIGKGYTYAADWWPLGCMMVECMIGRVPFRKKDEEPVSTLWERILHDPWYLIFEDPKLGGLNPTEWGMCDAMIDILLQKDPERRLTEPNIQSHDYFGGIDWEVVRRGDYTDPYGLQLHPELEDNTRYFPKLCLEEVPSVNMEGFDSRFVPEDQRTPLNDNLVYYKAEAEHHLELAGFAWSRDEFERELQEAEEREEEMSEEKENVDIETSVFDSDPISLHQPEDLQTLAMVEVEHAIVEEDNDLGLDLTPGDYSDLLEEIPAPPLDSPQQPAKMIIQHRQPIIPLPTIEEPSPPPSPFSHKTDTLRPEPYTHDHVAPPVSPVASLHRPGPASPIRITTRIPASPRSHLGPLPSVLPSAGLSVSDMISIPSSPGLVSPGHMILRRHAMLPSEDTLNIPGARLSVELHGTLTTLGDEEWEQLDSEGIDSAPNGHNISSHTGTSFFRSKGLGVLRPKPSALKTSNLRRQTKPSDSTNSSSSRSPQKQNQQVLPIFPLTGAGMFGGKIVGMESTRKALERLKFPKLKRTPTGSISASASPSPPKVIRQVSTPAEMGRGREVSSPQSGQRKGVRQKLDLGSGQSELVRQESGVSETEDEDGVLSEETEMDDREYISSVSSPKGRRAVEGDEEAKRGRGKDKKDEEVDRRGEEDDEEEERGTIRGRNMISPLGKGKVGNRNKRPQQLRRHTESFMNLFSGGQKKKKEGRGVGSVSAGASVAGSKDSLGEGSSDTSEERGDLDGINKNKMESRDILERDPTHLEQPIDSGSNRKLNQDHVVVDSESKRVAQKHVTDPESKRNPVPNHDDNSIHQSGMDEQNELNKENNGRIFDEERDRTGEEIFDKEEGKLSLEDYGSIILELDRRMSENGSL